MAGTYYRVVKGPVAKIEDFYSYHRLGKALRFATPTAVRRSEGISVYESEAQARDKAIGVQGLGRFIAMIEIPDGAHVTVEQSGKHDGHVTLYGDPTYFLHLVTSIVPA